MGTATATRPAAEAAADEHERRNGVRVLAFGRLAAVPAVALTALASDEAVAPAFWPVLLVAALFELGMAAVGLSRTRWSRVPVLGAMGVDLAALGAFLALSGSATSDVRHLLWIFPAAVAFALRPWATATATTLTGLTYLAVALPDLGEPAADGAAQRFALGLLWIGVVATMLSAAREDIAQRTRRLLAARGQLLSAVLDGESRRRRATVSQLHEEVLQHLLAARQDLHDLSAHDEDAERAHRSLNAGIDVLREAVDDLHPVALDHGGLHAALRALADREARTGGFAVDVQVDGAAAGVRDDVLVDVAREVLTNVRLHARAASLHVEVRTLPDGVSLLVEDDGRGFEPAAVPDARRVGLAACRERIEALGGAFTVRSAPGRGTRVFAVVPAPRAAIAAGRARRTAA